MTAGLVGFALGISLMNVLAVWLLMRDAREQVRAATAQAKEARETLTADVNRAVASMTAAIDRFEARIQALETAEMRRAQQTFMPGVPRRS